MELIILILGGMASLFAVVTGLYHLCKWARTALLSNGSRGLDSPDLMGQNTVIDLWIKAEKVPPFKDEELTHIAQDFDFHCMQGRKVEFRVLFDKAEFCRKRINDINNKDNLSISDKTERAKWQEALSHYETYERALEVALNAFSESGIYKEYRAFTGSTGWVVVFRRLIEEFQSYAQPNIDGRRYGRGQKIDVFRNQSSAPTAIYLDETETAELLQRNNLKSIWEFNAIAGFTVFDLGNDLVVEHVLPRLAANFALNHRLIDTTSFTEYASCFSTWSAGLG